MTIDRVAAQWVADQPYLGGGEVVRDRPAAKVVLSTRVRPDLSDRVLAEAARTGVVPSALLADLIAEALDARAATDDTVTVSPASLHRALDAALRNVA